LSVGVVPQGLSRRLGVSAMPLRTLPEAAPRPVGSDVSAPRRVHPAGPAISSAVLLWLAFPPSARGVLAWGALVPLFTLFRSEAPRRSIYLGAWAGGLVFWLCAVQWVRLTDPSAWFAWVVLATFLSMWWPAFLLLVRPAVLGLRLPLMLAAPIGWV